ncbi:MAG: hypothetical protein ABWZ79_05950 [Pedobacter agri]
MDQLFIYEQINRLNSIIENLQSRIDFVEQELEELKNRSPPPLPSPMTQTFQLDKWLDP